MKSLYKHIHESLLSDIETTIKSGDKIANDYQKVFKEFDNLKSLCSDLSNWTGGEYELQTTNIPGVNYDYQLFVKCTRLTKYFGLTGKNIFIDVNFSPSGFWEIQVALTNSNQLTKYPNMGGKQYFIKSAKQRIYFKLPETSYKGGRGSRSKYDVKYIIDNYLMPKLSDFETFKTELIDIFKDMQNNNDKFKFIKLANI
jgi:hypothetical protein